MHGNRFQITFSLQTIEKWRPRWRQVSWLLLRDRFLEAVQLMFLNFSQNSIRIQMPLLTHYVLGGVDMFTAFAKPFPRSENP